MVLWLKSGEKVGASDERVDVIIELEYWDDLSMVE